MHIGPSHAFHQRQSLVVTAQLQQAIRLLQMGNTELQGFIEAQAEENPFVDARAPQPAPTRDRPLPSSVTRRSSDDDWDRIAALPDDRGPSLYAHVEAHVEALGLTPREARIAGAFLDALEPSGWIGQSVAEVAAQAGVTETEAETVLNLMQRIEPAGLFARNLAECLYLQARAQRLLTPVFEAVLRNLPLVAAADMAGLARVCRCQIEDLRPALRELRALDPKPGAQFDATPVPQLPPDLIARRGADGWVVDLNRSTLPSIVVRAGDKDQPTPREPAARAEAARYIAERLSVARWLARAVAHRNETSLRIGAEIVRRQQGFLEHGPASLRPMTLREVAEAVGVHESTVSRVCSGLMMATPQGCFPLKHFFTAALSASSGDEAGSAGAVRHRIRELIRAESPRDPLSDEAIAQIVSSEGIQLARRTVAKYREMMDIPSSAARRRRAILDAQTR